MGQEICGTHEGNKEAHKTVIEKSKWKGSPQRLGVCKDDFKTKPFEQTHKAHFPTAQVSGPTDLLLLLLLM